MTRFIGMIFLDEVTATEALHALKELEASQSIAISGMAVVEKDEKGTISARRATDEGPIATLVGILIGGLAGLAGGPVGGAIAAAGGAMVGRAADHINLGEREKFAAKVNYQIIATKQAKQIGCPMTGGKLNKETALEVGYAKVPVAFCCEKCQGKVKDAQANDSKESQEKLILMLFGDEEKFVKAFKIGDDKEEGADEEKEAK